MHKTGNNMVYFGPGFEVASGSQADNMPFLKSATKSPFIGRIELCEAPGGLIVPGRIVKCIGFSGRRCGRAAAYRLSIPCI